MELKIFNKNESSPDISGDSFDNLYPALLECFGIIALGYISGRFGMMSKREGDGLTKFTLNAALPAYIFKAIVPIHFTQIAWKFVLVVTLAKILLFASVAILTILFTRDVGKAGIYGVFCTVSNDLAMGIPVLKALYEKTHEEFIDCLYFLVLVSLALILPIGLLMMEFQKQRSVHTSLNFGHILWKTFKAVLKNPAVLGSILGIPFNFILHQDLPNAIDTFLTTLSQAFPAAALFYLGLSVVGKIKTQFSMAILVPLSLVAAKVLILPLIIRALLTSFNVGGTKMNENWSIFGFIYGTVPPAPTSVVFAGVFGIQEDMLASALMMGTIFSAPVMFSSSKMASVSHMNVTQTEYRTLLSNTRNDISFVAIALTGWVILVLFLSRRYKVPPHGYTICLAITELCLCVAFLTTKSSKFMNYKKLCCFLITTFLLGTHCWTAVLAVGLTRIRCGYNEIHARRSLVKISEIFCGWGLPICIAGLLLIILQSQLNNFSSEKNDFFHFLHEQTVFSAFWVTVLFICILVCISSLLYMHRYDSYCKCAILKRQIVVGERTPLVPKVKVDCHRCKNSRSCIVSMENSPFSSSDRCSGSTDIEDLDIVCPLQKSQKKTAKNKKGNDNCKLKLEKYYEGENHQCGRHIVVILCNSLIMIICIFYCMWILVGDQQKSGIFLEIQVLVVMVLSGQVLAIFVIFGFERALIIDPILQKLRFYWYGVNEVILPKLDDLPADEYHICEQFVHYHKAHCANKLFGASASESDDNVERRSFLGAQLVDWLLEVGLVSDRETAVHYGNSLLRGRVISHIEKRYYFKDTELMYEFCSEWEGDT